MKQIQSKKRNGNKKNIELLDLSESINVMIRRRITSHEERESSLSKLSPTCFSPIQNQHVCIDQKMKVDGISSQSLQFQSGKGDDDEAAAAGTPISPPYLSDLVKMQQRNDDDEITHHFEYDKKLDNVMSTFSSVDEKKLEEFRKRAAEGEKLDPRHVRSYMVTIFITLLFAAVILYQGTYCDGVERWPHHSDDYVDIPERAEMFRDYAKDVVPDLENFYVSSEARLSAMGSEFEASQNDEQIGENCTQYWVEKYRDIAGEMFNVSFTNPKDVRRVVDLLGLSGVELVENVLSTHLSSNVSTQSFFDDIEQCASQNHMVYMIACDVRDDVNLQLEFSRYSGHEEKWRLMFAFAVVLEELTRHAVSDSALYASMFQRILGGTRWQEILHEIETRKSYSSSERTFFKQKVNSVFTVNRDTLNSMMSDGAVPDKVPSLWLNILEAAHYDLKMGTYDNTAVALELIKYLNTLPYFRDGQLRWPVTKMWADLYISWNLAFVLHFGSQESVWKLLLPSVLCTSENDDAQSFITARAISLGLRAAMFRKLSEPDNAFNNTIRNVNLALHWGRRNIELASLGEISVHDASLEKVFLTLCGDDSCRGSWSYTDSGPIYFLSDEWYDVAVNMIATLTVWGTGLGIEHQIGLWWIEELKNRDTARLFRLAEFVFPIFCLVSILSKSATTLPLGVLGLFKMGFPEILMYTTRGADWIALGHMPYAFTSYLNALGLTLHHFSACYVICAVSLNDWTLTRPLSSVLLLTIIQHWLTLLKYSNAFLFVVSVFLIEILFQWEVLSNMQHFCDHKEDHYDVFGPGIAQMMVSAHLMYVSAAFVELLVICFEGDAKVGSISPDKNKKEISDVNYDEEAPSVTIPTKEDEEKEEEKKEEDVDDEVLRMRKSEKKISRRVSSIEKFSQSHIGLGYTNPSPHIRRRL